MLIHLEWVDLCGKTTLIDKMSKLFKNVTILGKSYIIQPLKLVLFINHYKHDAIQIH